MKKRILTLTMILMMSFTGCSSNKVKVPFVGNNDKLKSGIEQIEANAEDIIINSEQLEPTTISKNIKSSAKNILQESESVKDINVSITKDYAQLQSDYDKLEEHQESTIQNILKWLITLSVIGIAVFGVLFFLHGSTAGMTGACISGVILFLSLFIQQYLAYLLVVGGVLFTALAGLFIYQVIIRGKSFKEVVASIEALKEEIPENIETIKETLSSVQSEVTSKIVDKIKGSAESSSTEK